MSFCIPSTYEFKQCPRRKSLNEHPSTKLNRLDALYPKVIIKQHQLERKRANDIKQQARLQLQATLYSNACYISKNTIMSTNKKKVSTCSSIKSTMSRINQFHGVRPIKFKQTPPLHKPSITLHNPAQQNYADLKQVFSQVNFMKPCYTAQQLCVVEPYEDKENISSVYNLRMNKTYCKLVINEMRKKSSSTNGRNFMIKSNKSYSTHLSVKTHRN